MGGLSGHLHAGLASASVDAVNSGEGGDTWSLVVFDFVGLGESDAQSVLECQSAS